MAKLIEMMNRAEKTMIDQMTNEQYSAYMSIHEEKIHADLEIFEDDLPSTSDQE